jgi:hypothetical protein
VELTSNSDKVMLFLLLNGDERGGTIYLNISLSHSSIKSATFLLLSSPKGSSPSSNNFLISGANPSTTSYSLRGALKLLLLNFLILSFNSSR